MKKLSALITSIALAVGLSGCGQEQQTSNATTNTVEQQQSFKWKLVTSWPKNYPGLGTAPERFAQNVEAMSNGRLKIKVYGAGELVPGFEVFDTVSSGTAEMGHSAAYYWKGKIPAAQFFTAIPFGMNAQEVNGWLHHGGGMELWKELYEPYNLIPAAGGNTGVQMAGWFKKEVNSVEDLKGLKMRIPGLGGEVLEKLGGVPLSLTGGEIFTALQTGAIDATEWVGPYNDLAFGLNKAAEFYYYSGWHEPGANLEFLINKEAYASLPSDLQAIVTSAMRTANQDMLDEYTARNNTALDQLKNKHNVKLRKFSPEVMQALKAATMEVISEQARNDEAVAKVWRSYSEFLQQVKAYHQISEMEYYSNR
ncbi:Monocarboxylate 2-oxoacid-binding periplasmic protein precursor [Pseudoalteromonas sp. P1-9]|uniref:TRAP transporter substrate-binding protein n=1 Tax=Pseudoalteromonas sp. P1-9 TaxID=1710354 RepID=UPI0006D60117|nr:TRAP transporter substrate-binding protein DctP [Pseudoalteromonas sp. P1-9]KPV94652.1 Monocarboxylate 2-oxoacid-binding periplasmic protein precursor [Pseudoalteromonas sp. P1-9]